MTTSIQVNKDALLRSHKIYSLEAAGAEDITNISTEGLSSFFNDARHHLLNVFTKTGQYTGDISAPPSLISKVITMDKALIEKMEIPCVTGFTGDTLSYMKSLESLRKDYCDNLLEKVLRPFDKVLGFYINNPSKLSLLSRSELLSGVKLNNIDLGRKELLAYNKGDVVSTKPFFSVYRSQGDFAQVSKGINGMMYNFEKNDDELISKLINDCSEKISILVGYLQGDFGKSYNISKTVSQDLSSVTLKIAEACEFYSLVRFSATAFANAFKDQLVYFR